MIAAVHQPAVLPYPGFWLKMRDCDVWGWLANVKLKRRGFHNRVRIGGEKNEQWLTVPCMGGRDLLIEDAVIAETFRPNKAWRALEQCHGKLPFWEGVAPRLEMVLASVIPGRTEYEFFAYEWCHVLADVLGCARPEAWVEDRDADASARLAQFAEQFECDTYLSGPGGREYMDEKPFAERGVKVRYQNPLPDTLYSKVSVLLAYCTLGPRWADPFGG